MTNCIILHITSAIKLINNFINFTKSARTNVTTQDIKIQLTSIKYFTNKLEKLVIIAQKENAQVIIPKI